MKSVCAWVRRDLAVRGVGGALVAVLGMALSVLAAIPAGADDASVSLPGRHDPGQALAFGPGTVLDAGDTDTCAITTGGTARCWGNNDSGQAIPPADLGTITTITAGSNHTCAITTTGTARCWGNNTNGQAIPPADLGTITTITAGSNHTCAITTTGTAR
ncbi:MAG TPA: RCC1 domain-containing protein, partial [Pseudonocardiaceae bacterium]|nr:RCC1 domain-containing protein [Pseudonocardiaceae bacterium]